MGKRDLNDQLRDGVLDLEDVEPLPTPELDLHTAEDLWLATICQAPKYLEHSRIVDVHLSPRARVIVATIRRAVAEGFGQVDKAYLTSDAAMQVALAHANVGRKVKLTEAPLPDLGSIPQRLRIVEQQTTIDYAQDVLIKAWAKDRLAACFEQAAKYVREKGVDYAQAWMAERQDRLRALSSGVHWVTVGDAARQVIATMKERLADADAEGRLLGTNFAVLDRMVRNWGPGRCTMIGGWNGHGKSTIMCEVLQNLAVISGVNTALISLEDAVTITAERQLTWIQDDLDLAARLSTGQPASRSFADGYRPEDVQLYELSALEVLAACPMRIVPGIGWSLDQVCHAVQDACRRGCRVVGVDYLQAIPMPSSYNDKSAWYDVCARRIKAAGTTLGAHVIIGVQLNRPPDKDERKHRPNRFMGDYAAVCEQIAENYMLCWRREKGKRFEAGQQRLERATIIIDKAKEGEIGDIDLAWCQVKHMYRPWRDDETPELWEQKEGHRYAKR